MGQRTEEQLRNDGYVTSLKKEFTAKGDITKTIFNLHGASGVTPPQWLQKSLTIAAGLGIFDVPVVQETTGDILRYSFYFKDTLDESKFDLAVNGLRYQKNGWVNKHRLNGDNPEARMDTFVTAILDFCAYHNIECEFQQRDERTLLVFFNSNADMSAYLHAANRDNTILSMVTKILGSSKPDSNEVPLLSYSPR